MSHSGMLPVDHLFCLKACDIGLIAERQNGCEEQILKYMGGNFYGLMY
jgi:hypothetical protein